jgi:CRP/FNR family transcriptional regulator, cyclic AMP receptor protein
LDTTNIRPLIRAIGGRSPTSESPPPGSKQHLLDRLRRLSWLSPEQIREIGEASRMLEIKRGGNVYMPSENADQLYVILSGMAALWLNTGGKRVLMGMVGPGDIVGISALLGNHARPFQCEALSECKVAAMSAATLRSMMMSEPATFEKAIQATFGRWEQMLKRYAQFMLLGARGRLAMALLELAERFGVPNDRGLLLPFMLSHAMLGAMVGASRQHVTMQLVEFEREEAVMRENRRLVVIPEKLRGAMK